MHIINTEKYSAIEFFAKSEEGKEGKVTLRHKASKERIAVCPGGRVQYRFHKISLESESCYEIIIENCLVSVIYLSECQDILEHGVRFLKIRGQGIEEVTELSKWYNSPYRDQFHFSPFVNWMNDPNGLCWFQGYYHLYYQANPHEQKWGHMYWGHAVSKDLVHWQHLPYALFPQEDMIEQEGWKGGAFSGSAVVDQEKMVFFLTRHSGPAEDTEEETIQYQTMVRSKDGIHFGKEEMLLQKPGKEFSFNFRDPKVYGADNKWKMVIAAKKKMPSIALFESEELKKWKYMGCILEEDEEGVYTFECPDLFRINDKWVVIAAWMKYTDEKGRKQPTYCYIGDMAENKFLVQNKIPIDFGGDFYALQTFEHEERRIGIGWVCDFHGEHIYEEDGAYGSIAIPREIYYKEGKLYFQPVREIYQLLDQCVYQGAKQRIQLEMPENGYYIEVQLNEEADFVASLCKNGKQNLSLVKSGHKVQIVTEGVRSESVEFSTELKRIQKVEVFKDRKTLEVYINDGEAVGTKVFYQEKAHGTLDFGFSKETPLNQVKIYTMKSIW